MVRHVAARDLLTLLAGLAGIAIVTVLLRMLLDVSPTTVALALLLVVLGMATIARLRIAIVVSTVAMLTLNFFFLPPVGTFTIADPQNWIALFAFLVVAIIASNLSAAAQHRAREANYVHDRHHQEDEGGGQEGSASLAFRHDEHHDANARGLKSERVCAADGVCAAGVCARRLRRAIL